MLYIRIFARGMRTEKSLNRVSLIGRVGSDAQLKGTMEHPVVNFGLATNQNNKTEWHRIAVFRPDLRDSAMAYVKSGTRLFVEGKLSYGHIINSQGVSTPTTNIVADQIIFLTKSGDGEKEVVPEKMENV